MGLCRLMLIFYSFKGNAKHGREIETQKSHNDSKPKHDESESESSESSQEDANSENEAEEEGVRFMRDMKAGSSSREIHMETEEDKQEKVWAPIM